MVATQFPPTAAAPAFHAPGQPITAEVYFAECDLERSELIDGEVIELTPPGFRHGEIAVTIASYLRSFVKKGSLGRVAVEGGFRIGTNPDTVRAPDVSFIEASRLKDVDTRAFINGAPTLAVEIVSPGDQWADVARKVRLYLEAGSAAVWIVEPESRTIEVRTANAAPIVYAASDILKGEPALPGFKLSVSEVFE